MPSRYFVEAEFRLRTLVESILKGVGGGRFNLAVLINIKCNYLDGTQYLRR